MVRAALPAAGPARGATGRLQGALPEVPRAAWSVSTPMSPTRGAMRPACSDAGSANRSPSPSGGPSSPIAAIGSNAVVCSRHSGARPRSSRSPGRWPGWRSSWGLTRNGSWWWATGSTRIAFDRNKARADRPCGGCADIDLGGRTAGAQGVPPGHRGAAAVVGPSSRLPVPHRRQRWPRGQLRGGPAGSGRAARADRAGPFPAPGPPGTAGRGAQRRRLFRARHEQRGLGERLPRGDGLWLAGDHDGRRRQHRGRVRPQPGGHRAVRGPGRTRHGHRRWTRKGRGWRLGAAGQGPGGQLTAHRRSGSLARATG